MTAPPESRWSADFHYGVARLTAAADNETEQIHGNHLLEYNMRQASRTTRD